MAMFIDDLDDRVLDLGQPMTARRKRLLGRQRDRVRPAYEKIVRRQLGAGATQDAIDFYVEERLAGGRIPDARLRALEAASAADLPIETYDRLLNELTLCVVNDLHFMNLRTRLRLMIMRQELLDAMHGIPANSRVRRDAEALCYALEQRIADLAW